MAKFIERRYRVWFYRNVWPKLLKNKLKRCMKMILRFEFSKKTSVQISGCCKHCWECQVLHMPIAQGMYIKILKMKIAPVNIMFRVPLSFILLGLWTRRKCYSNCVAYFFLAVLFISHAPSTNSENVHTTPSHQSNSGVEASERLPSTTSTIHYNNNQS